MAVLPEYQNQGIGSLLVIRGLEECLGSGYPVVVVAGHPYYYPRFGLVSARSKGLHCEYKIPDDVFMVVELKPEAPKDISGFVKYRPEFSLV